MFSPTYGNFINFRNQRSKFFQQSIPIQNEPPPPYSSVSPTVAAASKDLQTPKSSNNPWPDAPQMVTEEGNHYLPTFDSMSQHSRCSVRSRKSPTKQSRHSRHLAENREGLQPHDPSLSPSGHS